MGTDKETNARKGEMEVEFGADARVIRLDLNAICILEQNLDKPFHAIISALGFNACREALFVGIRTYGNTKTSRAEVGRMMASGDQGFKYYAAIVLEAMQGPAGEDFSKIISDLRADEDVADPADDTQVEGCDGPDVGNQAPAQGA